MEDHKRVNIYTDGGSRGNPGPAAIGVVIRFGKEEKVYSEAIGNTTNNVAEYKALVFALKKTKQVLGKEVSRKASLEVNSDSELMVNQLNGKYKLKDENLKSLFLEIWNLKQDFKKVEFNLLPRDQNKAADKLVNIALETLL